MRVESYHWMPGIASMQVHCILSLMLEKSMLVVTIVHTRSSPHEATPQQYLNGSRENSKKIKYQMNPKAQMPAAE